MGKGLGMEDDLELGRGLGVGKGSISGVGSRNGEGSGIVGIGPFRDWDLSPGLGSIIGLKCLPFLIMPLFPGNGSDLNPDHKPGEVKHPKSWGQTHQILGSSPRPQILDVPTPWGRSNIPKPKLWDVNLPPPP